MILHEYRMSYSVDITLCCESAALPTKGSPGAAGYDVYSTEKVTIPSGERQLVNTGIRMRIPSGLYGRIAPRSGLAVRNGIDIGAGVIDSDYRGEIKVLLINNGKESVAFESGTRIAQIVFERIESPTFYPYTSDEFDAKDDTTRGSGGFGSSGMTTLNYMI